MTLHALQKILRARDISSEARLTVHKLAFYTSDRGTSGAVVPFVANTAGILVVVSAVGHVRFTR